MTSNEVVIARLRRLAEDRGGQPFIRIGGAEYTYGEAFEYVQAVARGLAELGIQQGDRVGIMAGNLAETVWAWLGTDALGAIDVPFNSESRGRLLAYFVADAEPRVLIGTADYLEILAETIEAPPELAVCIGPQDRTPFDARTRSLSFEELVERGRSSALELADPQPGDTATVMFTSGTTGPSKGVMLPHGYYGSAGDIIARELGIRPGEVAYNVQPLFHIDARVYVTCAIASGSVIALGRRFSVTNFWRELREHDAAVFGTIGTMLLLLAKQEPSAGDADQPARRALCSSTPPDLLRPFERRFGLEVVEAYGLTEAVMLTCTAAGETQPGRVGTPVEEFEVCLLDDADEPVGAGAIGELCYRPRLPFTSMQGYWRKPDETLEAWRNLWFHTGDFLRRHEDGQFEYIGRKKDAIRRRGENISAWEVEQAVGAHPDVLEVAAIGVPSELGEEDVAVLIVARPGRSPEPAAIVEFAARDLQRFAVPRYVEFVESFPKTPSERIAKSEVRARGITGAAWDAEKTPAA